MSAATSPAPTPGLGVLDVSGTPQVSISTLVKVELRKMIDTRAGKWLLIAIGAITALIVLIFLLTADAADKTFFNLMGTTVTPQAFLLPVLGILLVTQEWGQRTGMVTFTLEPHRSRVIGAKIVAAIVFGVAAMVVAILLAALGAVLAGGPDPWAGFGLDDLFKIGLLQITGVLQGLAFGLLILNSAGAIVAYFAVPIAFSILTNTWSALQDAAPWIDWGTSSPELYSGDHLSGEVWAQLLTSGLIWVVLPFLLGLWRVLRAEVK
jgi:ABC-type transport system involved in multi-copper enzyme maturation permease subunit